MQNIVSFIILLALCTRAEAQTALKLIPPSSTYIQITGRVKNDHDSVTIYWSGTAIKARFVGTELKASLRDEHGKNYFNIIIDDDSLHYIKPGTLKQSYVLATGLKPGEHTIELIKRNEWETGKTWFYGLEVSGKMINIPPRNEHVIEFFGNSITAGYAIENYSGGDSADSIYTNNYYTYAALTARHFHADMYCTVKSGIGILVSWFPLIMPEMYDRLDPSDSLSKWDFKQVKPDLVVVNLLQNDSWLVKMPDHPSFKLRFGNTPPDEKTIIEAYRAFVKKIRVVYPEANIICAMGSMDATREGSPWPGYVKDAVAQLHDKKIYTHFFPFMQKDGHPRKEDNAKMAKDLIAFIEKNKLLSN